MLVVTSDSEQVLRQRGRNDGVLIEPSCYINNFLVRSLDKFGVVAGPHEVLEKIEKYPNANIPLSQIPGPTLKRIFARPDFGNTESLFNATIEQLKSGDSVYTTPGAAGMLMKYIVDNEIETDFFFNLQVEIEEIHNSFAEKNNKPFIPIGFERLLKLFSIFYGREIKNKIKFVSAVQLNMIDADKGDISFIKRTNFKDLKDIVLSVYENHKEEFSSNNVFNKLLEDINNIMRYKKDLVATYEGETLIILPSKELIEKDKQVMKQILEG